MHDNRPLQVLPAFYKRFEYIVITLEYFMDLKKKLNEQERKPLRSVVYGTHTPVLVQKNIPRSHTAAE